LTGDAASLDVSTKENLKKLEDIGIGLLEKHVSTVNLELGKIESVRYQGSRDKPYKTNREQLTEFARKLSAIRRAKKIKKEIRNISVSPLMEQMDSTVALSKVI
jgi:hypothetical protein